MAKLSDLAVQINAEHKAFARAAKTAIGHAIACGRLLKEVKGRSGHGGWLPWLKEHCPEIPERTAQRYMLMATHADLIQTKSATVADLTVREACKLIEDSKPRRQYKTAPGSPGYGSSCTGADPGEPIKVDRKEFAEALKRAGNNTKKVRIEEPEIATTPEPEIAGDDGEDLTDVWSYGGGLDSPHGFNQDPFEWTKKYLENIPKDQWGRSEYLLDYFYLLALEWGGHKLLENLEVEGTA
jgi:Protein of unknown function (DUF3102)